MTTRKEFLSKLLPAVVAAPFVTLPETKNTRPEWMTEGKRCRECTAVQPEVELKRLEHGKSAIVTVQQVHAIWCSHFSKERISFEL